MPEDFIQPLADAHYGLFLTVNRDLLRAEAERVSRACKKDEWAAWRDEYYGDRAAYVTDRLAPVFDAFSRAAWATLRTCPFPSAVEAVVLEQSREAGNVHVMASLDELADIEAPATIPETINKWESTRAEAATTGQLGRLKVLMRQLCGISEIPEEVHSGN